MESFSYGRTSQQFRFLRRQFLQKGKLPFTNVLTVETITHALEKIDACWKDRIYSPLVTLWVFLGQVLSADHSCRSAVARLIAHLVSQGRETVAKTTKATLDRLRDLQVTSGLSDCPRNPSASRTAWVPYEERHRRHDVA